jgi:hypothetical protein
MCAHVQPKSKAVPTEPWLPPVDTAEGRSIGLYAAEFRRNLSSLFHVIFDPPAKTQRSNIIKKLKEMLNIKRKF